MKIVSACLAGIPCRYDCASKERGEIKLMVERGEAIAVCPEELGGLPTPRTPAEKIGDKIITKLGDDVTDEYQDGARKALGIALENNVKEAFLKSKSPMCGVGEIYDGTFMGNLTPGDGVFTELLKKNDIKVQVVN